MTSGPTTFEIPTQREPLLHRAAERIQNRYYQMRIASAAASLVHTNGRGRLATPARQEEIWRSQDVRNQSISVIQCANGVIYHLKRLTAIGDYQKLEISCWRNGDVHYGSEIIGADYSHIASTSYETNVPLHECTADLSKVSHDMSSLVGMARSAEYIRPPLLQAIHERLGIESDRL